MYRITFSLEQKTYTVRAKTVSYDYPMVTVRGIIWSSGSPLILAPEESTRKRFEDVNELIIPFHSVQLVEEISERKAPIREIPSRPDAESAGEKPSKPTLKNMLLHSRPPSPGPVSPPKNDKES